MSMPKQNTVWGEFLLGGKRLGVLSGRHLNETIENRLNEFMRDRKPFAHSVTAPWLNNQPRWEIKDEKLYLTDIGLSVDTSDNYIVEYEGEKRVETIEGPEGEREELIINRTKVISSADDRTNMQKLFGVDKIFAKWVNGAMKLLVNKSSQKSVVVNRGKPNEKIRYEVTMDILILEFENGVLIGSEEMQESYPTVKNYIEEPDDL